MKKIMKKKLSGLTFTYYLVSSEEMLDLCNRNEDTEEEGTEPAGLCIMQDQEIYINENQHGQQIEVSIIHETLEAYNYLYKLELTHRQIEILELVFFNMFKDFKEGRKNE